MAPATPASKTDRFLPYLNDAMPRYDITTTNRVRGFLASVCFESNYFRATKEGKARAGTRASSAQAKYWLSGYMGRGLIQVTHEEGYQEFQDDVGDTAGIDVMAHPELLELPKWAVEVSCHYWQKNNLNKYADKGKIGFAQLEGAINTGSPNKKAWGEIDREKVYTLCVQAIPDGFVLINTGVGETTGANHSPDLNSDQVSGSVKETVKTTENQETGDGSKTVETTQESVASTDQTVVKEVPSFTSKFQAGIAWILSGGTLVGGGIKYAFEQIDIIPTFNIVIVVSVAVALAGLAYLIYDRSAERATRLNIEKMRIAGDKTLNTVHLVEAGSPGSPQALAAARATD